MAKFSNSRPRLTLTLLSVVLIINGVTAIFDRALKCRDEECDIPEEHFSLYSRAKQAFDSEFDFKNGKEIVAFSNAIRILNQRYENADDVELIPGSKVVRNRILTRPEFQRAMITLNSIEGQSLVDLYRIKLNDKKYNTSCSSARVARIKRAENLMKQNVDLKWMFEKLHQSFVKRSALKCLKYSCGSVNTAMTFINPEATKWSTESPIKNSIDREFKKQELAICQFVTGTSDSKCRIEAKELSQLKLDDKVQIDDLLTAYARNKAENNGNIATSTIGSNNNSDSVQTGASSEEKWRQALLNQCHTMEKSLDEALYGLKWFSQQQLLSEQQVETRRYWCPELSYWIEIDRICKKLPQAFEGKLITTTGSTSTTSAAPIANYDAIESNDI